MSDMIIDSVNSLVIVVNIIFDGFLGLDFSIVFLIFNKELFMA